MNPCPTHSASTHRRELLVPGEARALVAIRWVVLQLAHTAGLSEEEAHQLELAVDEACANIVEHAYGHLPEKPPIHLEFDIGEGFFSVSIFDRGRTFDITTAPRPSFPEHYNEGNERGAGLFLIHTCADEISYERMPDERNCMKIVKRKKSPESLPG